jgi:hypothetical protein
MSVESNLRNLNLRGKKYSVWAYENDGQCNFEDFLAVLETKSVDNLIKLIALIDWVSNDGPPNDNPEQCCLVDKTKSDNLYVFVVGGIRVFWFIKNEKMIICSCIEIIERNNLDSEIRLALSIKSKIEVIRYGSFKGN